MIKKEFKKIWLALLVLAGVVLGARFLFISQHAPSLQAVLTQDQFRNSFDWSLLVATMLAFSFVALSLAKGYEIFNRSRTIASALLPEEDLEAEDTPEKEENESKQNQSWLAELEDMHRLEQMLRKSNISLAKECERLKSENEDLLLKFNSFKVRPRRKTTRAKKRIKR